MALNSICSSQLYQKFDLVLLLSHGRALYSGPGSFAPTEHFATVGAGTVPAYQQGRKILKRDKTLFLTHVIVAALLGVFCGESYVSRNAVTILMPLLGGLYFQTGITIAGFQSRVGCLFFLVRLTLVPMKTFFNVAFQGALIAFSSLSALYNVVEARPLFLQERSSGYYRYDLTILHPTKALDLNCLQSNGMVARSLLLRHSTSSVDSNHYRFHHVSFLRLCVLHVLPLEIGLVFIGWPVSNLLP